MTFGSGFFPIQTDDSFRQRMQSSHHRGECIFEELHIDMLKCFPLDPMHLHLAEDVNEMGPLESFSAFPFESYMQTIRRSIHSNNAIAKQAAQRFAEKVFHDCNSGAVHNNVLNNCEKEKKPYAVLRKAGSKELFIAARNWMPSDDMCLYHSSITDSEVEACIRPRPEWLLIDRHMLAELEAKSTLVTAKRIRSILSNSDDLEDTLTLTNSKR
ncbi:unnamed protein product [Trichobilharzia regenti]|nr:unnamed protein product [Trichobilharzia regenti]